MAWPGAGKAPGQIAIIDGVWIDRVEVDQGLVGAHHHKQPNIAGFRQLVGSLLKIASASAASGLSGGLGADGGQACSDRKLSASFGLAQISSCS
jgi:hypothetical protein